jgi:hypothetical protein
MNCENYSKGQLKKENRNEVQVKKNVNAGDRRICVFCNRHRGALSESQ